MHRPQIPRKTFIRAASKAFRQHPIRRTVKRRCSAFAVGGAPWGGWAARLPKRKRATQCEPLQADPPGGRGNVPGVGAPTEDLGKRSAQDAAGVRATNSCGRCVPQRPIQGTGTGWRDGCWSQVCITPAMRAQPGPLQAKGEWRLKQAMAHNAALCRPQRGQAA